MSLDDHEAALEAELAAELAQLTSDTESDAVFSELSPIKTDPNGKISLTTLALSVAEIMHAPDYDKDRDRGKVEALMRSFDASNLEWKRYEFWDESRNYTRNLIATDNKHFTLMLLCWNPKKPSPIHAHAGSNCWMHIVQGTCKETRYAWPKKLGEPMELLGVHEAGPGGVFYINDEMGLHQVENPDVTQKTITLHLYAPPYQQCKIFLDPSTGRESTSCVSFYSESGVKVDFSC